jgi:N-acetylmuramoyl-L-alanine amidase
MNLKRESKGADVQRLQVLLTHSNLGRAPLTIDGRFGFITELRVQDFQRKYGLTVDGIAGRHTFAALEEVTKDKFMIAIHGGHGGLDPSTGKYATDPSTGKRYQHKGIALHTSEGWFYEGVENRIIANAVAEELRQRGIFVMVTHHPYKCDYGHLRMHANKILPYLQSGYKGYMHSFHSNAISTSNSKEKLDKTRGGWVFTSKGLTFSDEVAKVLLEQWLMNFGSWTRLRDRKDEPTANSDAEANFQVLRDVERIGNKMFGAILEEFGFFTSVIDAAFIIEPETRKKRIQCAINTALKIRELCK